MTIAWKDPATSPETGTFLARYKRRNLHDRIVVVERSRRPNQGVIGVAGGMFEWDLGEMTGWYPIPDELIEAVRA